MIAGISNNPYFARHALANDPDFQAVALVAMLDVADDVAREVVAAQTPPAGYRPGAGTRLQDWHDARTNVAKSMMQQPGGYLQAFCIALANQNGLDITVQANTRARARTVFDLFAGA